MWNSPAAKPANGFNTKLFKSGSYGFATFAASDATIYGWGTNYNCFLIGTGSAASAIPNPVDLGFFPPGGIIDVAVSHGSGIVLAGNGKLYGWGCDNGMLMDGTPSSPVATPTMLNVPFPVVGVGVGASHVLIINSTFHVYSAGDTSFGALGRGGGDPNAPEVVSWFADPFPSVGIGQVTGGTWTSLAMTRDLSDVYVWGYNAGGQLGVGDYATQHNYPTKITWSCDPHPGTLFLMGGGGGHSHIISANQDVYGMGQNDVGQIGLPLGTTQTNCPMKMPWPGVLKPSTFLTIALGDRHTSALGGDNVVYSWGANYNGELGDGTTTVTYMAHVTLTPVGRSVLALAVGHYHGCALVDMPASPSPTPVSASASASFGSSASPSPVSTVAVPGNATVIATPVPAITPGAIEGVALTVKSTRALFLGIGFGVGVGLPILILCIIAIAFKIRDRKLPSGRRPNGARRSVGSSSKLSASKELPDEEYESGQSLPLESEEAQSGEV